MSEPCDHFKKPCPFANGAEDGAWVCFYCSKNTTVGAWPTRESLPVILTVGGASQVPLDPNVQAAIRLQIGGRCWGCGDPGGLVTD